MFAVFVVVVSMVGVKRQEQVHVFLCETEVPQVNVLFNTGGGDCAMKRVEMDALVQERFRT